MKIVALKKIISEIESGARPKGGVSSNSGTIPSLGAEHLNKEGRFNLDNIKFVPKEFFGKMKKGKIKTHDILIVKDGATTGKVSFVDEQFPYQDAAINEHLFRLIIDNSRANPHYVFHYLFCEKGQYEILKDFRGATVGGISRSFPEKVFIPLPPLLEQKRIAAILDKADAIRRKRQQAIQLADAFLRSVFLDMFGDPVTNPKGWDVVKTIDVCDCIVPGRDKPKSFTGNIAWIITDDLNSKSVTINSKKKLGLSESEIKQVRAKIIPKRSVIMTCVGDLGLSSIAGVDCVVNQQLHTFQCSEKINNIYLMYNIPFQKPYMYRVATLTTVPYLNKMNCNAVPLPLPPIELQKKYANISQKVWNIQKVLHGVYTNNSNIFNSLTQRAFRGEL